LSPKNGPLGRRPGPGKDGQNNAKTPLLVTFHPEKLKLKTKNFFFDFENKTSAFRNHLSLRAEITSPLFADFSSTPHV